MKFIAKTAFVKSRLPKAQYVINPYIGCKWGCRYCYSKNIFARFFGIKEEWGTYVFEKEGLLSAVEREKKKMQGKYVLLSSTIDPYQPIEAKRKIVRKILETSLDAGIKWSILTKSPLVVRDIDLFKRLDIEVGVSIGFFPKQIKKILEPYAPLHEKRIEALVTLLKNGIKSYLMISPYIHKISDVEWMLSTIDTLSKTAKAEFYIMVEPLNVRYLDEQSIELLLRLGMDGKHLTKLGRSEIVGEVGKLISKKFPNITVELYSH